MRNLRFIRRPICARLGNIKHPANLLYDIDIGFFVIATDIVGFARLTLRQHRL